MAGRLSFFKQVLGQRTAANEAAQCARALAAMKLSPDGEVILRAERLSRAVLTDRIIQSRGAMPWPMAISRQLDPEDPAYLPPLGVHLSLCAKGYTLLGRPDLPEQFILDPWGWCGAPTAPMISVWFKVGGKSYTLGKIYTDQSDFTVSQKRSDDQHAVITTQRQAPVKLECFHWPVVVDGQCSIAMVVRLSATEAVDVELGFSIQPMSIEGATPIFQLERTSEGVWLADDRPIMTLARNGNHLFQANANSAGLWNKFSSMSHPDGIVGPAFLRCREGQASAIEVFRSNLKQGESLSQFAVLYPSRNASSLIVRTNEYSLWNGAIADRKGLHGAGATLDIGARQWLLNAVQHRLLIDDATLSVSGCLGAVALARLGFIQRAGERLSRFFSVIGRDGRLPEGGEVAAVLAWAAAEYVTWTGEQSWVHVHRRPWSRLLRYLSKGTLEPGGHFLFGVDGSLRWSEIWRVAGLLASVRVLRNSASKSDLEHWGISGATGREGLIQFLGDVPWAAKLTSAIDGSSAALLCAGWLGIVPLDSPEMNLTMAHLEQHLHLGGVVWGGGAHVAATAILLALKQRQDLSLDGTSVLAQYASATGALPTAYHSKRGALGEGDNALSSALFALLALDSVQIHRDYIEIRNNLRFAQQLPTPFGPLSLFEGEAKIRWRGVQVPIRLVKEDGLSPES